MVQRLISVYEKARGDGVVMEKLGSDTLWLKVQPLWLQDRPHIAISEIANWFASYVYMPKLRNRVVLDQAIRDALSKFDAMFGYAESFDTATNTYSGLMFAKPRRIFSVPRHCSFELRSLGS
jgi:hypothetical protein